MSVGCNLSSKLWWKSVCNNSRMFVYKTKKICPMISRVKTLRHTWHAELHNPRWQLSLSAQSLADVHWAWQEAPLHTSPSRHSPVSTQDRTQTPPEQVKPLGQSRSVLSNNNILLHNNIFFYEISDKQWFIF